MREDEYWQSDAFLGIYIHSAKCVSEIKRIAAEDYELFSNEFHNAKSIRNPDKNLKDVMKGSDDKEKLSTAWTSYVKAEIERKKLNQTWRRAYIRASEFEAVVASLSTVHFGAQFPFFFPGEKPKNFQDLYHLRLHSYIGRQRIRSSVKQSGRHTTLDEFQHRTLDICKDRILSPALQFMDHRDYELPPIDETYDIEALERAPKKRNH